MSGKSKDEVSTIFKRLQETGYWFWTKEIYHAASLSSIGPRLERTRSEFVDLLQKSDRNNIVQNLLKPPSPLTTSLAIRHAIIVTNSSAEILDRTRDYLAFYNINVLNVDDSTGPWKYNLKILGPGFAGKINNKRIMEANESLQEDLITVISHGSNIREFKDFVSFQRLKLAEICGDEQALGNHFSQLYLQVSRQIQGLASAMSGGPTQKLVADTLEKRFGKSLVVSKVPGNRVKLSEEDNRQFDLVYKVHRGGREIFVAIEIAFQETTNSVIERKAKQAKSLLPIFDKLGYYLCFVVDGAGYFARKKALGDIIQNSHLCVGFKESELDLLCDFIEAISRK